MAHKFKHFITSVTTKCFYEYGIQCWINLFGIDMCRNGIKIKLLTCSKWNTQRWHL